MVTSGMAVTAVADTVHADPRQRPHQVACPDAFDVGQAGPMTTLTLHVVVDVRLGAVPASDRTARGIALPVHRMAAEARVLLARIRVQRRVGVSVLRPAPVALEVGVAVAAR